MSWVRGHPVGVHVRGKVDDPHGVLLLDVGDIAELPDALRIGELPGAFDRRLFVEPFRVHGLHFGLQGKMRTAP